MTVYYVSHEKCTPDEPSPGWYFSREDEDGNERICGPLSSKHEALDQMSDGAYSEWLDRKQEENYEQDMIDAGRGHLLRKGWE